MKPFTDQHFEAANLVKQAYERTIIAPYVLDRDGVQAFVTANNVLVIPGTEGWGDWVDNFNVGWGAGRKRQWHKGFLRQALVIWHWLEEIGVTPNWGTGHSLGAASGQILFYSKKLRNKEAIFFASPKPLGPKMHTLACDNILNICRDDDKITKVPKKFQHVGRVELYKPLVRHWGQDHSIDPNYLEAMKKMNEAHG